jgi:hypothetical protein
MTSFGAELFQGCLSLFEGALDSISLASARAVLQDDDTVKAGLFARPVRLSSLAQRLHLGYSCGLCHVGEFDGSTGQLACLLSLCLLYVLEIAACDGGTCRLDLCCCGLSDTLRYGCCERAGRETKRGLLWLAVRGLGRRLECSVGSPRECGPDWKFSLEGDARGQLDARNWWREAVEG